MKDWSEQVYLGDGLYAQFDGYQIELWASNGLEKTDHVFLEPGVLANFYKYVAEITRLGEEARRKAENAGTGEVRP